MNTQEVSGDTRNLYEGDKLDRMFKAQYDLMQKYKNVAEDHLSKIVKQPVQYSDEAWKGGEFNLHTREGNVLIKEMIQASMQELAEAVQVLKSWKPWKQTEIPADVDHWKEEMVDAFHFFMEALLLAGVTPDELYELYFKKKEVNEFRIETKY